jgi:hypothetical protein
MVNHFFGDSGILKFKNSLLLELLFSRAFWLSAICLGLAACKGQVSPSRFRFAPDVLGGVWLGA